MKRDFELIRKLLFWFEEKPDPAVVSIPALNGYDDLTLKYHLLLLAQAGLIDYEPELTKTGRIIQVHAFNLSWQGHEFLDSIRDDGTWSKIKVKASSMGQSLSYEIIKALALKAMHAVVAGEI